MYVRNIFTYLDGEENFGGREKRLDGGERTKEQTAAPIASAKKHERCCFWMEAKDLRRSEGKN